MKTKIKIIVCDGVVASVYSTDPEVKVTVLDLDNVESEAEHFRIANAVDEAENDPTLTLIQVN